MLTLADRPDAPARKMSAGAAFAIMFFPKSEPIGLIFETASSVAFDL